MFELLGFVHRGAVLFPGVVALHWPTFWPFVFWRQKPTVVLGVAPSSLILTVCFAWSVMVVQRLLPRRGRLLHVRERVSTSEELASTVVTWDSATVARAEYIVSAEAVFELTLRLSELEVELVVSAEAIVLPMTNTVVNAVRTAIGPADSMDFLNLSTSSWE